MKTLLMILMMCVSCVVLASEAVPEAEPSPTVEPGSLGTWVVSQHGVFDPQGNQVADAVGGAFKRSERSRAEVLAFWFAVAGTAADIYTTQRGLKGGCTESNWILGERPSTGKIIAKDAALLGGLWWSMKHFERGELAGIVFGGLHLKAAYDNSQKPCYQRGG